MTQRIPAFFKDFRITGAPQSLLAFPVSPFSRFSGFPDTPLAYNSDNSLAHRLREPKQGR